MIKKEYPIYLCSPFLDEWHVLAQQQDLATLSLKIEASRESRLASKPKFFSKGLASQSIDKYVCVLYVQYHDTILRAIE